MPEPTPVPIDAQVACVDREVALRKSVYAKRVEAGKMAPEQARRELASMEAVGRTLRAVKAAQPLAEGLLAALGYDFGDVPAEPATAEPDDASVDASTADGADDHAGALARFEARARDVGLRGDGLRQLLSAYPGAVRPADLSARQLGEATGALVDDDAAQAFNADGFVRAAVEKVRNAPERHRERAHEAAVEAAGERFGGGLLAGVRAALDKAAGLPVGPDA